VSSAIPEAAQVRGLREELRVFKDRCYEGERIIRTGLERVKAEFSARGYESDFRPFTADLRLGDIVWQIEQLLEVARASARDAFTSAASELEDEADELEEEIEQEGYVDVDPDDLREAARELRREGERI